MRLVAGWLVAVLLALAGGARAQATVALQVVDLAVRPGVTQRMLVLAPQDATHAAVLMTGGAGLIGIRDDGSLKAPANFLVRTRELFVQQHFAVLLPDPPSDQLSGISGLRSGREHSADLGAVIAWARQRFGKPVVIIGTSRGSQSAAQAGIALTGAQAPDGVVLTSSALAPSRGKLNRDVAVSAMPVERIRQPVLVVHHERDACYACEPRNIPTLMNRLGGGNRTLIMASGGEPLGDPCGPWDFHGYNGIEARVVADISEWIRAHVTP